MLLANSSVIYWTLHIFHIDRLVTIAAVYGAHEDSFNLCEDGNVLQAFYIGMIILLTFKAVVNVFLVFHSSRVSIVI